MKTKTLTDYPLALGQALRRTEVRERRKANRTTFFRWLFGIETKRHAFRLGEKEMVCR